MIERAVRAMPELIVASAFMDSGMGEAANKGFWRKPNLNHRMYPMVLFFT